MKLFRNWKELNEPRFTTFGGIGMMALGAYFFTEGFIKLIQIIIISVAVGLFVVRKLKS